MPVEKEVAGSDHTSNAGTWQVPAGIYRRRGQDSVPQDERKRGWLSGAAAAAAAAAVRGGPTPQSSIESDHCFSCYAQSTLADTPFSHVTTTTSDNKNDDVAG
ncbi:hypothetical protein GTA08_BOTSDO03250 [Botryosphaeria dothidea]|uniref:Uncharacterized protein n=1 Tax=Botryosphaeria dothidea TaxID=55169 RepID=A0A8H4N6Y2_9PEZI|nr:hypothetical protein GTA08_BOTSDO03250 [Botryosphaeria dothidea]